MAKELLKTNECVKALLDEKVVVCRTKSTSNIGALLQVTEEYSDIDLKSLKGKDTSLHGCSRPLEKKVRVIRTYENRNKKYLGIKFLG